MPIRLPGQKEVSHNTKQLAVFNPSGSDTSMVTQRIAEQLAKIGKTIIVEFPCVGVPKMAFLYDLENIDRRKSIDQLLIDYERKDLQSVFDYVVSVGQVDLIPIHPQISPISPTLTKLNNIETLLNMPGYLRSVLEDHYQFILYVLQGQLIHPMTMFSIRTADHIVLHIHRAEELPWATIYYRQLSDEMMIKAESIFPFSDERISIKQMEISYTISDLIKKIK